MKTLQEVFPEYTLMTVNECIKELEWISENDESSNETGPITCSCGTQVKVGGWVGHEHAWCPNCHKGMQNMTGLLPTGNASGGHIDFDKITVPEDGRIWAPKNIWGF